MNINKIDENTTIVKASEVKEIVYYWDYEKNKYKPEDLTVDRQVFVYFKCPDCGKEWGKPLKRFYESDRKCPDCRKREILVINNENIMKFWNYEKNREYDPNKLTISSRQKPHFICKDCGYEWSVEIAGRKNKSECPKCNGHYRQMTYDEEYPRIAERYSPNNPKPLNKLTGTDRKEYILMICPKHGEYESQLGNLISNYNSPALGCPKCYNQDTDLEDSLYVKCPDIARDLQNFDPKKTRYGSRKHGVFVCSIHGDTYEGKIANIAAGGTRCPTCRRLKSLANFRPDLEKWLDPEYNQNLEDYLPQSNKTLHFVCKENHKFDYVISDMPDAENFDCPICNGVRIEPGFNDVATLRPELVNEWSSNNSFSLSTVGKGSHFRGLWVCPDCGYEYPLEVRDRFEHLDNSCPVCNGRIVITGINDLATKQPELVDKLSDELKVVANKILFKQTKWLKWKCQTCRGVYNDTVKNIMDGVDNCPYCKGNIVLSGFNDLKTLHPELVNKLSDELKATADKILFKETRWLKWKCQTCGGIYPDSIGNVVAGINNCPYCANKKVLPGFNDMSVTHPELVQRMTTFSKETAKKNLFKENRYFEWICPTCHGQYNDLVKNIIDGVDNCPYCANKKVLEGFNDLASLHPELVERLSPQYKEMASRILCKDNKYLEWICPTCHGQYYDSIINILTGNDNCPYCAGKKLLPGFNDFKTLYPELVKEWHPTNKYIGLDPGKISPKSNEKAFFQCPKCDEIYPMAIQNRVIKYKRHKEPCPRCGRTRPKSLYFAMKKHR